MRQGGIDPHNQNPEHGVVAQLVGITVDRSQVRFHKSQPRSPAGLQVLFRFSTLAAQTASRNYTEVISAIFVHCTVLIEHVGIEACQYRIGRRWR